ncbi:hypothetical protein CCACVL1_18240 [Corchorus capsularis]|uniref:Uncharacterized protein n=1 Tax=Corchorus capsularis TaxID=210143 RepID=A0A1R3HMD5_COCAP|nr:hypothetical protein CCACVL1_18240 [Corchorus capsularis]
MIGTTRKVIRALLRGGGTEEIIK